MIELNVQRFVEFLVKSRKKYPRQLLKKNFRQLLKKYPRQLLKKISTATFEKYSRQLLRVEGGGPRNKVAARVARWLAKATRRKI